ncbi:MAG: hypothetical protein KM310_10950 [Clostridiales bacterium]|nr:hypothetical protein [Clostridiales bacterium]
MFKDLPLGKPEAQAAFYEGYNGGEDQFGRKVTNPAGIDLTPYVASQLGLGYRTPREDPPPSGGGMKAALEHLFLFWYT